MWTESYIAKQLMGILDNDEKPNLDIDSMKKLLQRAGRLQSSYFTKKSKKKKQTQPAQEQLILMKYLLGRM